MTLARVKWANNVFIYAQTHSVEPVPVVRAQESLLAEGGRQIFIFIFLQEFNLSSVRLMDFPYEQKRARRSLTRASEGESSISRRAPPTIPR